MLTLADEGGRGGLGNADITDKMLLKGVLAKYCIFFYFVIQGEVGKSYADNTDKAKGGGGGNADIG